MDKSEEKVRYKQRSSAEVGYQGFLSFEFCHLCPQRDAHENDLSRDLAGIDRVDEQVQQARDFMEQIMADAKGQLVAKV